MEKVRWMTVPDGDGPGAGDDVLELGGRPGRDPRRWPPPAASVLGTLALLAGLAIGYAAGAWRAGEHATPAAPSRAAAPAAPFSAGGFPLSQSGPRCSVQTGRELQVGLQVTNLSPAAVRLRRVEVVLPLGGLRVTSQAWGSCGSCRPLAKCRARFSPHPPAGGQLLVHGHLPGAGEVPEAAAGPVHAHLRPAGPPGGDPAAGFPRPGPGSLLPMSVSRAARPLRSGRMPRGNSSASQRTCPDRQEP